MLDFILGAAFMFFFLFIPAVLNVNPRDDDYRTQKSAQNHEFWKKEEIE